MIAKVMMPNDLIDDDMISNDLISGGLGKMGFTRTIQIMMTYDLIQTVIILSDSKILDYIKMALCMMKIDTML